MGMRVDLVAEANRSTNPSRLSFDQGCRILAESQARNGLNYECVRVAGESHQTTDHQVQDEL